MSRPSLSLGVPGEGESAAALASSAVSSVASSSSSARPRAAQPTRVLSKSARGSGFQLSVEWSDGRVSDEPFVRFRKDHTVLVREYERRVADEAAVAAEAAEAAAAAMALAGGPAGLDGPAAGLAQAGDGSALQPAQPALSSGALPPPGPASAWGNRLPDPKNLMEYTGGSDPRALDEWLNALALCEISFNLSPHDAWRFAVSRLRGDASIWFLSLSPAERQALAAPDELAKALRAQFQPVGPMKAARRALQTLRQGSRHVGLYIADFRRLLALIQPKPGEEEAMLCAFEAGLRPDLADKILDCTTLQQAIEQVTRHEAVSSAHGQATSAAQRSGGAARVAQLELGDDDGNAPVTTRQMQEMINAVSMQQATRPAQAFGGGGRRGGGQRGGAGRGRRSEPPGVPGVSPDVVRQRWGARQCVRCGEDGHIGVSCPNTIRPQRKN